MYNTCYSHGYMDESLNVMLRERSHTPKCTYCIFWSPKTLEMTNLDHMTESRFWGERRRRKVRVDWEGEGTYLGNENTLDFYQGGGYTSVNYIDLYMLKRCI